MTRECYEFAHLTCNCIAALPWEMQMSDFLTIFIFVKTTLRYLTLPYWEGVLPHSIEASGGPNARPRLNP